LAALAALAGCQRPAPHAQAPAQAPNPLLDYASPPELTGAVRGAEATVSLSGVARPGASIRLASPDGTAISTSASSAGRWTLSAAAGAEPRLFSLSEALGGRLLRARGYIAALPAPGAAAVMLRPGTAAEPLAGQDRGPRLTAVDFDRSGAGVVAGLARPGEAVRITLDGADAGEGRANAQGIFTVPLSRTLAPSAHTLTATSALGSASAAFEASPASAIARPPFTASRAASSWRIDWMTPGGGVQTTVLFDPAEGVA
jgi:hypothetical protein